MSASIVSELVTSIVRQIEEGQAPSHIAIAQLSEFVHDLVLQERTDSPSASVKRLVQTVDEYWRFDFPKEKDIEKAFSMGMLHFLSLMVHAKNDNVMEEQLLIEDSRRLYEKRKVFQAMEAEPGIRHMDLAKTIHMKPSALTQMLNRNRMDVYYTTRYIGREKYYYLSQAGERLNEQFKLKERLSEKTKAVRGYRRAIEELRVVDPVNMIGPIIQYSPHHSRMVGASSRNIMKRVMAQYGTKATKEHMMKVLKQPQSNDASEPAQENDCVADMKRVVYEGVER